MKNRYDNTLAIGRYQSFMNSWLQRLSEIFQTEPKNKQELMAILEDANQKHLLDSEAFLMIKGVLQVAERQVRDIMVPYAQMVVIEDDLTPQELIPKIIESAHSRFPVIKKDTNEIIGLLLAKDILRFYFHKNSHHFDMHDILYPVTYVPESKRLDVLLKEFRLNYNHMAIVTDEYGATAGLVTIEDILEEIVGDIEDEHYVDDDGTYIREYNEKQYIVQGLTPIDRFNNYFDSKLSDKDFDTMGGLVAQKFGHLPKRGETIEIDNFQFNILHSDKRRIRLLRVSLIQ